MSELVFDTEPVGPYNPYALERDEVGQLTRRLLEEQPPNCDERHICYRLQGDDKYSDIGRHVERVVFDAEFGNDSDEMQKEYGPYEDASTFFVSIDTDTAEPTGALRVIKYSPQAGLKTLNDLQPVDPQFATEKIMKAHHIDSLEECADIGTVAVLPEFRSAAGAISVQLYRAMYLDAMSEDLQHFVSIIDKGPLDKLTGYLGIPFVPLNDSQPFAYLGSESSQAVYGHIPDFYEKMNRRRRRTVKGWLARKATSRLVEGTEDHTLQQFYDYKK